MSEEILTDEQKASVTKKVAEGVTDYVTLAQFVFSAPDLNGRSPRAKLVRDFLIGAGIITAAKPAIKPKVAPPKQFALTPEQEEFIGQNIKTGISPRQVTELLFANELKTVNHSIFITPYYKCVQSYIKEKYPEYLVDSESAVDENYVVPRSLGTVIKKVNKWTGSNLVEDNLSMKNKRCLEKLLLYLQSPRFISNYNSYTSSTDKELFESEYVRAVWDKPDLTNDEINLYLNCCMDYINIKQVDAKKNKLNQLFNETQDQQDMSIKLTEILKTVSEEYNSCVNRIEKVLAKLNGSRAERIKNHQQSNASILNIVELFQEENERKVIIMKAEMQKKLVSEEADKIESMSAWKARVLGISKEESV